MRYPSLRYDFRYTGLTWSLLFCILAGCSSPAAAEAQEFRGFDKPELAPVRDAPGEWALKIVVFNVGQADAILVIAPNGDVCLVDSGETKAAGNTVAEYLLKPADNGVGELRTIHLLYTTHYDLDHIGGLPRIVERDITIRKAYDQGLSKKRQGKEKYLAYCAAVGDPNDNLVEDEGEDNFVRHRIRYGRRERMGTNNRIEIRCVSVRGDTKGTDNDLDLDPSNKPGDFDENPGSIALLVRLGEFEFYTAGDQTDDDWKSKPAVEKRLIAAGAILNGHDIDVLKVSHHGSDTSTSRGFVQALDPEVAIISSKFTAGDRLPKKTTLKMLQENRCHVLITGAGQDPATGDYANSTHAEDDGFAPLETAVFNGQGNVTILVSADGNRYTVYGASFARTYSAVDAQNQR